MTNETLIIGSRGSALALWQSNYIKSQLEQIHSELAVDIRIIQTEGDKILDTPLSKIGGKGLFTKTLEDKLLDGTIDLAVHSLKDLPTILPEGLMLSAVSSREDPRDVLISNGLSLTDMPNGATIATGSLRRQSQLLNYRPDFNIRDLRGNVPTRIDKFNNSDWDGMLLARAGLKRLGLLDAATEELSFDIILPAVGQGALGLETRQRDFQVSAILAPLNDADTQVSTAAERAFLRTLEGGCQVPIGAYGEVIDGELHFRGYVGSLDGQQAVRGTLHGSPDNAETLGTQLANQLRHEGAEAILEQVRESLEADD